MPWVGLRNNPQCMLGLGPDREACAGRGLWDSCKAVALLYSLRPAEGASCPITEQSI